jgi:hypothetical protein
MVAPGVALLTLTRWWLGENITAQPEKQNMAQSAIEPLIKFLTFIIN